MRLKLWSLVAIVLALAFLAGCAPAAPVTADVEEPQAEEPVEAAEEPVISNEITVIPHAEDWMNSPHADITAEAFNHWNEEDPAEVEAACATCHSTTGYQDYLGLDGSAAGTVETGHPIGQVIQCEACHNAATAELDTVTFPSGVALTVEDDAQCLVCHQGRASTDTVNTAIDGQDLDTVNAELGFVNIHYYAAAASLYGGEVRGGYQYEGKSYQIRFAHTEDYNTCTDCHNAHTLEVEIESCAHCHEGVDSTEALLDLRMNSSLADYDGDGDVEEGIYYEVEGLREMLMTGIQAYASEVAGAPIAYSDAAYPYFFNDTNADGTAGDDEAIFPNAYASWTPRLLQAAYNYQVATKDHAGYVHNSKYHIALLFDSIESLNEALSSPVDLSTASRNDPGHFDGTAEAFRHWDADGEVPGSCAKCHTSGGLQQFVANNANIAAEPSNSFTCTSCHDPATEDFSLYVVDAVSFPSGASLTFGEGEDSNMCLLCHQGRSSTTSVNRALAGKAPNTPDESIRFANIHYFAAGATLFGGEAQGAYQFEGKEYVGRFVHGDQFNTCSSCHDVHALELELDACEECHESSDPSTFRISETRVDADYDGDGDQTEGIQGELTTMADLLWAAIQVYAADTAGMPITKASFYPYYFADANGNDAVDEGEAGYNAFTPELLRAVYNYQYLAKDPGAFAHNGTYALQIAYDSIEALDPAAVAGLTRPALQ